ncbi:MAG: NTP transferase domain-containing protein [Anaerolineales bacterium]|nr:NTP transferase domain-containing protein [Anaerolineales bacterium]
MVTIAIQAGGRSSRLGRDKAFVSLAGKPIIEHLLERIQGLGDELLITTNQPKAYSHLDIRTIPDTMPDGGALAGILTALTAAKGESVLVLACDMPFVSRPLLEHQLGLAERADIIVPRIGDYLEPLHAVYKVRTCRPAVVQALASGERRIISFFSHLRILPVEGATLEKLDPQGLSFFNVNTPEDLARAEKLLTGGPDASRERP